MVKRLDLTYQHPNAETMTLSEKDSFYDAVEQREDQISPSASKDQKSYSVTSRTKRPKVSQQRRTNTNTPGSHKQAPSYAIPRRTSSIKQQQGEKRDLVSFHRKSCQLFSSLDETLHSSQSSPALSAASSRTPTPTLAPISQSPTQSRRTSNSAAYDTICTRTSSTSTPAPAQELSSAKSSFSQSSRPLSPLHNPSTISWTSDETRRVEYAKIDQAHSGIRRVWKMLVPACWQSGKSRMNFFKGQCDGNSVRRMRIKLPDMGDCDEKRQSGWGCMAR